MLDREFEAQSVNPMFLEPESALGWYDAGRKTLELVAGVQSPYEAAESVAFLLGDAQADLRPTRINMNFAYCGGGFGGRDQHLRFRSTGPWPRSSFRIVQFVWPTIASISFNPESSGTPSRCGPG